MDTNGEFHIEASHHDGSAYLDVRLISGVSYDAKGFKLGGLHFYFGDEPKPAPEFFRERHSKTRPIVCLETGESFMGNPAAARPLHVSPAAISQAVRYGSPVNGLHFYHGDEPKPAPEFFKPAKGKGGKSPAAIAAAAKAAAGNSAPGTDYREHGIQRDRRAVQ